MSKATDQSTFEPLLVGQKGRVRILTMNNPGKRNALSEGLYVALSQQLAEVKNDPNTGVIILTGANGFFCSGGDLNKLATRKDYPIEERRRLLEGLHEVIRKISAYSKPVIAAVEGGAAGAGFSLALACDMIVAAKNVRFSVAYVKVALSPDGGLTTFLAQALPRQLMTELCLTGEPVYAERLYDLGLVNRLTEENQVQKTALELAQCIATGPAKSMGTIKKLCRTAYEQGLHAQLEAEAESMVLAQESAEAAEGIQAFLNKRKPDFHK